MESINKSEQTKKLLIKFEAKDNGSSMIKDCDWWSLGRLNFEYFLVPQLILYNVQFNTHAAYFSLVVFPVICINKLHFNKVFSTPLNQIKAARRMPYAYTKFCA
ncbi:CLUMA_CG008766, isoform A [Clunio marinus]|uniref:CLUMA_CG008766, isoform A n=1 Tax=Clunio marinus TaxID=568069 RepID=A0A1J1IA65_9DIPT|nr:CLUMA_CG008766, isoform A [Clunio marinus]